MRTLHVLYALSGCAHKIYSEDSISLEEKLEQFNEVLRKCRGGIKNKVKRKKVTKSIKEKKKTQETVSKVLRTCKKGR